jgi:predicted dithiol-disulfide oxidoreductase (DUF899 family)
MHSVTSSAAHGWPEHGCIGCSLMADQVAHVAHLNVRDTTLVYVSRAPQADLERLKARMGWKMPWYALTDEFDTARRGWEFQPRQPTVALSVRPC